MFSLNSLSNAPITTLLFVLACLGCTCLFTYLHDLRSLRYLRYKTGLTFDNCSASILRQARTILPCLGVIKVDTFFSMVLSVEHSLYFWYPGWYSIFKNSRSFESSFAVRVVENLRLQLKSNPCCSRLIFAWLGYGWAVGDHCDRNTLLCDVLRMAGLNGNMPGRDGLFPFRIEVSHFVS